MKVDLDLAAYLAVRWFAWGRPASSFAAIQGISREYFNLADFTNDDELTEQVRTAQSALENHALLRPVAPMHVRALHSFLKSTENVRVLWSTIDSILQYGLWPQPQTAGKYSEDPHSVFFVVEDSSARDKSRYSSGAPWFIADLPFEVYDRRAFSTIRIDGVEKSLFSGVSLPELRPGSVGFVSGIPAEFFVGVNGCPVDLFDAAVGRWGRW